MMDLQKSGKATGPSSLDPFLHFIVSNSICLV